MDTPVKFKVGDLVLAAAKGGWEPPDPLEYGITYRVRSVSPKGSVVSVDGITRGFHCSWFQAAPADTVSIRHWGTSRSEGQESLPELTPQPAYRPQHDRPDTDAIIDPITGKEIDQHYQGFEIEPMEFSMRNGLNALQHTIIKYTSRYPMKNGMRDLLAARNALNMLIEYEEKKANA